MNSAHKPSHLIKLLNTPIKDLQKFYVLYDMILLDSLLGATTSYYLILFYVHQQHQLNKSI